MKKLTRLYISLCILMELQIALLLSSCSSTKKLNHGELLLDKNIISTKSILLEKSEIETYLKQKPNRKVLLWKFYLYLYNGVNQDKMEKKRALMNLRHR